LDMLQKKANFNYFTKLAEILKLIKLNSFFVFLL
jgi:hypothetical protein